MLKKLLGVWKFLTCKHDFYLKGTTKDNGEHKFIVNCDRCKLSIRSSVGMLNKISSVHKVRLK